MTTKSLSSPSRKAVRYFPIGVTTIVSSAPQIVLLDLALPARERMLALLPIQPDPRSITHARGGWTITKESEKAKRKKKGRIQD